MPYVSSGVGSAALAALVGRLQAAGFRVFTPQSFEEITSETSLAEVQARQDEIFGF